MKINTLRLSGINNRDGHYWVHWWCTTVRTKRDIFWPDTDCDYYVRRGGVCSKQFSVQRDHISPPPPPNINLKLLTDQIHNTCPVLYYSWVQCKGVFDEKTTVNPQLIDRFFSHRKRWVYCTHSRIYMQVLANTYVFVFGDGVRHIWYHHHDHYHYHHHPNYRLVIVCPQQQCVSCLLVIQLI